MVENNVIPLLVDYELNEHNVYPDPFVQFRTWFNEAEQRKVKDPNEIVLATVSPTGNPSLRWLLLKGFDERGFVFYTNYESKKAEELKLG